MSEVFDKAFSLTIGHEGGYSNHENDPGGETNYGISRRAYPNEDIKGMTLARAKDIYYNDYWLPLQTFELPDRIAILLFDAAVNTGKATAVRCLQRAVGVTADGILGPITRKAINDNYSRELLGEITAQRILYYSSLSTFSTFGVGWTRRAIKTLMEVLGSDAV